MGSHGYTTTYTNLSQQGAWHNGLCKEHRVDAGCVSAGRHASGARGPATTIAFLGLELDTVAIEVRLSQNKLASLTTLLRSWQGRKVCSKRELLSLVSSMSHALRAVKPGRSYTRRLIEVVAATKRLDQFVRLNREARAVIEWWHVFAAGWNGTAMMGAGLGTPYQASDTSGNWGCGY